MNTKICEECGKEFLIKWKYNPNKVCSKVCQYNKVSRLQKEVALNNNPMKRPEVVEKWKKSVAGKIWKTGENHPCWKGGVEINDGYRLVMKKDHPNAHKGKVREHRLILEEHLGRELEPGEIVHHINEDRLDNRIENLQLVSRAEHMMIHINGART